MNTEQNSDKSERIPSIGVGTWMVIKFYYLLYHVRKSF
jgi:hypothetical protein